MGQLEYAGISLALAQVMYSTDNSNWTAFFKENGWHGPVNDLDQIIDGIIGNSLRIDLPWWELQKTENSEFDPETVKRYKQFFKKLHDKGISVMLTLHHFTHPQWFEDLGGWQNPDAPNQFSDYVSKIIDNFSEFFGTTIKWVNTFNEPTVFYDNAYYRASFPPFKKTGALRSFSNFLFSDPLSIIKDAHHITYELIHEKCKNVKVGIVKNTMFPHAMNFKSKKIAAGLLFGNREFVKKKKITSLDKLTFWALPQSLHKLYFWHYKKEIEGFLKNKQGNPCLDFIGINYYGGVPCMPYPVMEEQTYPKGTMNALGVKHDKMWEFAPQGLGYMLEMIHSHFLRLHPDIEIIVTENGCCTDNEEQRIEYIDAHLDQINAAIKKGIQVSGYFHWTMFDRMIEWHCGLDHCFGLRKNPSALKKSGRFYERKLKESFGIMTR